LSKQKVYNMGVPGAGPASYMYMIDQFSEKFKAKEFVIFLYLGNDFANLGNSYWEEMFNNKPPSQETFIYRRDVSLININPPISTLKTIMDSYFLKNSRIFYMIYNLYIISTQNPRLTPNVVNKVVSVSNNKVELENYTESMYNYLHKIKSAKCVKRDNEIIILTDKIEMRLSLKEDVNTEIQLLVKKLISKKCLPIDNIKKTSLVSYMSRDNFNYYNSQGKYNIAQNEFMKNIKSDAKKEIFYSYLENKVNEGVNIKVVIFPAEYNLNKKDIESIIVETDNTKRILEGKGVFTINTVPELYRYYQNADNNALYCDGSHFNEIGHQFIAEILMNKLK